jgi:deoxyribose-phosphate aldolase
VELNRYIDHTLLRPDAVPEDIERLCREAIKHEFYGIVVNPVCVEYAANLLEDTGIHLCGVAGFPLGATFTGVKVSEALESEAAGADEVDVVANIGLLQQREFDAVTRELSEIRRQLNNKTILKVIIETPILSPDRWENTVAVLIDAGADFVKTGTGFFGAVSRRHVQQLKQYCGTRIKIKAAGGIRTAADASALILAGADRLGCSASVAIMRSLKDPNM